MTDTFVIRKKNREELLRKSVDTGAFEVVIQDRVTEQNGVKTINTGKKKFEVDNRKSQFEVCVPLMYSKLYNFFEGSQNK